MIVWRAKLYFSVKNNNITVLVLLDFFLFFFVKLSFIIRFNDATLD
jgi:hypothetical protein